MGRWKGGVVSHMTIGHASLAKRRRGWVRQCKVLWLFICREFSMASVNCRRTSKVVLATSMVLCCPGIEGRFIFAGLARRRGVFPTSLAGLG